MIEIHKSIGKKCTRKRNMEERKNGNLCKNVRGKGMLWEKVYGSKSMRERDVW